MKKIVLRQIKKFDALTLRYVHTSLLTLSLPPELAIAFVSKLLPASKSKSERILSENDYDKLCSLD